SFLFSRIDILISNAGIYSFARIEELSEEEWNRIYSVNLKGTFLAVQACLKVMQKQKYGKIVMTSSITGPITANLGMSHYGTTKAGIIGFMRAAALENAMNNITVNAIMPGNIMTEGASTIEEEFIRAQERAIPMGRWGKPEEVAYAMLFLASDESQYITGQTLIIDGGQIIRESDFGLG
ncbi:MAG: SDR family oxidoreductase, partial [Patescibacteria group bacterium]|nr:SDR family oxidoreductase [Patescibacteria group bacterium]